MDADPELHPVVFRQTGVARAEDPLDLDGALDGVERGRELGEEVVAGRVHDPPAVVGDEPRRE
jgi:hypothetical protein